MAYEPSGEASSPSTGAGAKFQLAIVNATLGISYTIAMHLQPIVPPSGPPFTPPNAWTYDAGASGGPWSWLLSGGSWSGPTETSIITTLNSLLAILKGGYGSDFELSLLRLKHWSNSNNTYQKAFPFPTVTSVAGTFGSNPSGATDPALGNVTTVALPCAIAPGSSNTKVGKMLVKLPAWELNTPTTRVRGVTGTTTPSGIVSSHVVSLVAYLSGAATRIIGVNGGQADNIADVDCAPRTAIARAAGLIT